MTHKHAWLIIGFLFGVFWSLIHFAVAIFTVGFWNIIPFAGMLCGSILISMAFGFVFRIRESIGDIGNLFRNFGAILDHANQNGRDDFLERMVMDPVEFRKTLK